MGGLIEELQRNIVNENVSSSTVLRQIKLAAAKLRLSNIEKWVDFELDGYANKKVPQYRIIRGVPRAFNPYNGWIPLIFDKPELASIVSECRLYHSISVLEGWEQKEESLTLTFPPGAETFSGPA